MEHVSKPGAVNDAHEKAGEGRGLVQIGQGCAMTKEELDELRAMTRGELDDRRAQAAAARQQREEELRDWVPPIYFIQREIDAERGHMRGVIEALAAYEREIGKEILARTVASWPRLK